MAQRVILHIGMMKSGTTFIQRRLTANPDELERQGIFFPLPWSAQVAGVSDLTDRRRARPGAWAELAAHVNAHPGTVLISMEFLVGLDPERIAGLSEELDGARVECLVTVRDVGRAVPAMWQEALQNRMTSGWTDYLRSVEERTGPGEMFWRQQSADLIVGRWVQGLGAEHVTVVTVPPPSAPSGLLWERFGEAAGLREADWVDGVRTNESLGVQSALLMGLLNSHFADVDKGTYNKVVKVVGKFVLPDRLAQEPRIGFVVPPWLHRESERIVSSVAASGARVVGDLEDLRPHDVVGVDPDSVSTEQLLEVAVDTLAKVLEVPAQKRAKRARNAARQK